MSEYVGAHWRGELSLEKSVFGSLLVLILLALFVWLIALRIPLALPFTQATLIVVLCFIAWASIGIARCTIKIMKSPGATPARKLVAVISLVVTLAAVAVLVIGGFSGRG
jgi:hypothetical protein